MEADGTVLLHWSEKTANPSEQDPLGLNLRVGARLGAQLLYCITSITPRARYYSFLTWCVADYLDRVKGTALDGGLRMALLLRERALTLGCAFDHGGQPCEGGGLIGSREAAHVVAANAGDAVRLDKVELSKNLAWDAYKGSLAGLDLFAGAAPEADGAEDEDTDESPDAEQLTEDDLLLSPAGAELARLFGTAVSGAYVASAVTRSRPEVTPSELDEWGKAAGLCALAAGRAPELHELRSMFLRVGGNSHNSHRFRHDSIVAFLFLASELTSQKIALDEGAFATTTYFSQAYGPDGTVIDIEWPAALGDIVRRWRLFHAHYYLSVALEGLFVSVVREGLDAGLGGFTLDDLISPLDSRHVAERLSEHLDCQLSGSCLDLSLTDVAHAVGIETHGTQPEWNESLDVLARLGHALSETGIEVLLRDRNILHTPQGIALSLLLSTVVTARFAGWRDQPQSEWLLNNVYDASEDITVPLVLQDLVTHYDNWLGVPFRELGKRLIQRFVVRQHETLAYDKSRSGGKILFHTERGRIIGRGIPYDAIGVTNPRFRSAIQVLLDLGWMQKQEDGILALTADGIECLERELAGMEAES